MRPKLRLQGFSAWIATGVSHVEIYGVEESVDKKRISCYIPSREGQTFEIVWQRNKKSGRLHEELIGRGTVDGYRLLVDRLMVPVPEPEPPQQTPLYAFEGIESLRTVRPFVFSKLDITDGDSTVEDDAELDSLGSIRLSIWEPEHETVPKTIEDFERSHVAGPSELMEVPEAHTANGLIHRVGVGEEIVAWWPMPGIFGGNKTRGNVPIVEFIFYYRPIEVLQAKGFVLPSHVDHDVEMRESSMPPPLEGDRNVTSVSGPARPKRRATVRQSTSTHRKPFIKKESKSAVKILSLYDTETWEAKENELEKKLQQARIVKQKVAEILTLRGKADALEHELQPFNPSVPLDIKKEETDVGVGGTKVLAIHEAREKAILEQVARILTLRGEADDLECQLPLDIKKEETDLGVSIPKALDLAVHEAREKYLQEQLPKIQLAKLVAAEVKTLQEQMAKKNTLEHKSQPLNSRPRRTAKKKNM
ncbi:hypothetical protein FIBSPDRAFT_1037136 [Athelia psychrophila]|uniref:DUF7918 domain-containing protein n=1 Tax=Athelia psychrophila TaxID=1759441 RepID=A0A166UTU1_9AGAM|nr:hypothetical protein FIBSPDRAFT_1037136 [Fibularhizoctonia sp. CBS 109695]